MVSSTEGETTSITTDDDESYKQFLAFLASSPSQSHQLQNKQHEKTSKKETIQRDRKATLLNRASMEMLRKTQLSLSEGETQGTTLKFIVPRNRLLRLPPSVDDNDNFNVAAAAVRVTLFHRFECLQPCRQEDDTPYIDAVHKGMSVVLAKALPKGYESGGWRCHALNGEQKECMQPNKVTNKICSKCHSSKPKLKPQFAYLRLLLPGVRQQRREYIRMIKECDSELCRCEAAEGDCNKKIADFNTRKLQGLVQAEDEDIELAIDIDLVQRGVWQRGNARALLPMLADRKEDLQHRLRSARAEIAIMIQCTYELAVIHAQKIVRRYLVQCSLPRIRASREAFARLCATLEIQKIVRGKLAKNLLVRLRKQRHFAMATKIQAIIRMRKAILERKRRWDAYMLQLRHHKATIIQTHMRAYAAKLVRRRLEEERQRKHEEQERDRIFCLKEAAATLIQSVFRRHLCVQKCINLRIEMSLHGRLLIYLERFAVDGCMWTFIKSINDDYIRFERTIKNVITREEKMATSFINKVLKARDEDHSNAWKDYHALKEKQKKEIQKSVETETKTEHDSKRHSFVTSSSLVKGGDKRKMTKAKGNSMVQIYAKSLSGKGRMSASTSKRQVPLSTAKHQSHPVIKRADKHDKLHREAKTLSSLELAKKRLRGQYLRFDIPNSLDDTIARFITSVALRYNYDSPGESCIEGQLSSAYGNVQVKEKEKCFDSDELIHSLHQKGIIFIRQILPLSHMYSVFRMFNVEEEFIHLAHALLLMLQKMHGGKHLSRRYLMTQCNMVLDLHQEDEQKIHSAEYDKIDSISCTEEFDDELPAGLFEARMINAHIPALPTTKKSETRSWAIHSAQKVIQDNEAKHPAYRTLKRGLLLSTATSVD